MAALGVMAVLSCSGGNSGNATVDGGADGGADGGGGASANAPIDAGSVGLSNAVGGGHGAGGAPAAGSPAADAAVSSPAGDAGVGGTADAAVGVGKGGHSVLDGGGAGGASRASEGGGGSSLTAVPTCGVKSGGSSTVATPERLLTLKDRWEEAWLGSPAVADLDGDGKMEIIVPRDGALIVWNADGSLRWKFSATPGRIWASPVVANLRDDARLEVAFASRQQVFVLDAEGKVLSGFPVTWENEMRSLAAGDVDGDGKLDLVAAPAHGSPTDVMNAWHADGSKVAGFPPNASGVSGCDDHCYPAGCYDQNIAVGDLDGDRGLDVVAPHDDAYASFHKGTGEAFDANAMFKNRKKTPGVRYLHDLTLAQQGWADDEENALQAHFTNTAPAIADIDGDGKNDIVMLGSVQNASQTDRYKGVALWVVRPDASRITGWETPFHAPAYVAGLWDYEGTNVVAATNQVTVADIDASRPGPEFVFAGFDGRIHAVAADKTELWSTVYTTDPNVLTGGVAVADLSRDGIPEIVFNTYSTDSGKGALIVFDAAGKELSRVPLPRRGAMPVPTLADVDGNGTLEIVVSLKDAEDKAESVIVFTVSSSSTDCLLWPTGRANLLRNGWIRSK